MADVSQENLQTVSLPEIDQSCVDSNREKYYLTKTNPQTSELWSVAIHRRFEFLGFLCLKPADSSDR